MNRPRLLCLGAGDGWHSTQLSHAAAKLDCDIHFAPYESLRAHVKERSAGRLMCGHQCVDSFDAILTRTMPAGTLEQVTFRLAMLHRIVDSDRDMRVINPPRALEIAIDKFATLDRVASLGYAVPETFVTQSRDEAVEAFKELGGDCVVKPVFGGEGRGVMRVQDAELAWTTFTTLERLGAVCYVQRFISPGGCDTRLLVIGDRVIGVRRDNRREFRTNLAAGAATRVIEPSILQTELARTVCRDFGLEIAAVDLIDDETTEQGRVVEVNAIPGWKAAQAVVDINVAEVIVGLLANARIRNGT